MTSRFSEWRVVSDLATFKEKLLTYDRATSTDQAPELAEAIVYRLNPLDDEQIAIFAQQKGLIDPEAFISEIHQYYSLARNKNVFSQLRIIKSV